MIRAGPGLEILLRLKRHRIHEIGREIADLNAAIQRHERDKIEIARTREDRADPDFPEAALFTAEFVRHTNELLRRQERQIARLEAKAGDVTGRLREAFLELKQIELTLDKRSAARALEDARSEQSQSDELWSITRRPTS